MEKTIKSPSGWLMLLVLFLMLVGGVALIISGSVIIGIILIILAAFFIAPGFIAIEPNSSRVMTLFGDYVGTVKDSGFFYTNPFYTKRKVSLRAVNLDIPTIKVNDHQGNPLMIGAVVMYRVKDTFKAAFAVEQYPQFVKIQSEAALRMLAGLYP